MTPSRRCFLKQCGASAGLALMAVPRGDAGSGPVGVLVDTTRCVGCRRCEKACNAINTDLPRRGDDFYRDESVLGRPRRMTAAEYTVVNRFEGRGGPVHAKFQCMHCLEPACVSACLVGALTRDGSGAVRYDAWKCMGCRYCLQSCPFQVPAYEFGNALTPQVRKCTLCHEARLSRGQVPACVESCPMEVMSFGRREDMLAAARGRLRDHPGRYVPRIYGEHEAGGTSWLYLSGVPFEDLGFPRLGYAPLPGYTEPIQHAIFKWFLPPAAVFAAMGGLWWFLARRRKSGERESDPVPP